MSATSPTVFNSTRGVLILHAEGESLTVQYDLGDTEVSGLYGWTPTVHFSEYVLDDGSTSALPFLQRYENGPLDVELVYDDDRRLIVRGCTVRDAAFIERDNGNRVRWYLAGKSVEGNLLPWAKSRPATVTVERRGHFVAELPTTAPVEPEPYTMWLPAPGSEVAAVVVPSPADVRELAERLGRAGQVFADTSHGGARLLRAPGGRSLWVFSASSDVLCVAGRPLLDALFVYAEGRVAAELRRRMKPPTWTAS